MVSWRFSRVWLKALFSSSVQAEQVLDQGDFGGVALHADPGDGREAGNLGSLEAALAGDDVGDGGFYAEEDGRQDAVLGDRCGQILQGLWIH